jgi:hypothetical protein
MKCSNCLLDAIYVLAPERVSTVHYCGKCLPPYLRDAASKGHLDITSSEAAPAEELVVEEEPAPEAAVEEVEVEEESPVEEEPAPVEDTEDVED